MTPANVISVELLVSGPSAIPVASICSFLVSAVETLGLQAWHLPGILFAFVFWRQCLSMQPRLTLNFLSSYLSLLSAGVLGTTRHTWLNSEELFQELGLHSLTQHLLLCLYFLWSVASSLASVIHDWGALPAFSLLLLPLPLLLLLPPRWKLGTSPAAQLLALRHVAS